MTRDEALELQVSIQLVSPASGEVGGTTQWGGQFPVRFHSISFPSEWGDPHPDGLQTWVSWYVSIQLVSPASGELLLLPCSTVSMTCQVSIQLVSPASGELVLNKFQAATFVSFHSISFPSEWGEEGRFI